MRNFLLTCVGVVVLVGCTSLTPSNQALITQKAQLALQMNTAIQADASVPAYVKTYVAQDTLQWQNFAAWANNQPATTQAGN